MKLRQIIVFGEEVITNMNKNETVDKKPVIIVALITAVCVMGNEMLFIVMPIYWKFFGLTSLWQIGILLSANRIIRIPINSLVGWCYQRIDKRTGLLIAVFLSIISTYSYGVLKGFGVLLLMRVFWGIAWSFLRLGGYLTVISSSSPRSRGQLIGVYNGLWGLGALFGMLIGGVFTDIIGITAITTTFAIIGICSIPFLIRYVPATISAEEIGESESNGVDISRRRDLRAILLTGASIAFVVYGIFTSTLSKVVENQFGQEIDILTFTVGAVAVSGVLQSLRMMMDPFLAPFIGKLSDQRFGRVPMLLIALSIAAISLMIIPLNIPFILFLFIIFIYQIVSTVLITTSDSMAADFSSQAASVKTMTNYTLFVDLGSALGPLMGYFVIDFVGLPVLYWFAASLIIILLVYWLNRFRKKDIAIF